MIRIEIIYALTKRCVADMREDELLVATDEELEEALRVVKNMDKSKTRQATIEREIRVRKKKAEQRLVCGRMEPCCGDV